MKVLLVFVLVSCIIAAVCARGRIHHRGEVDSDENVILHRGPSGGRYWRHGGATNNASHWSQRRFDRRGGNRHAHGHHHRHHGICGESGNWTMEPGLMFTQNETPSFLVYQNPPQLNQNVSQYSLEFRTTEEQGLLFMGACPWKRDLVALFLRNGTLTFAFNCGSGTAYLNYGALPLNDGKWHSVNITRLEQDAEMMLDGIKVAEGTSPGNSTQLNPGFKMYLGSVTHKMWKGKGAAKDLKELVVPFKGCIKNFQVSGQTPTTVIKECGVLTCNEEDNIDVELEDVKVEFENEA